MIQCPKVHDLAAWLRQHERTRHSLFREKRLTAAQVLVVQALIECSTPNPTHEKLRVRAGVSISTVQRTFRKLHAWGVLSWTRQTVAGDDWRGQVSNHYHYMSNAPLDHRTIHAPDLPKPAWVKARHLDALARLYAVDLGRGLPPLPEREVEWLRGLASQQRERAEVQGAAIRSQAQAKFGFDQVPLAEARSARYRQQTQL